MCRAVGERFAGVWSASETAALAVLWRDLGKYAAEFQAMISDERPRGSPGGCRNRTPKAGQSLQRRRARFGRSRWADSGAM